MFFDEHGPHGHGEQRPRRDEVALVRRAGKPRVGVVQVVGRPLGRDRRERSVQPVVVGQVVVEAHRRLVLEELRRALPHVVVVERIALAARVPVVFVAASIMPEQLRHGRVHRRDLPVGGRQLQQVDLAHFGAELVAEPAVVARAG